MIFVNHYDVFDKYLGSPPQPYIVYPDESVYVGKPNSLENPYLFEANYIAWKQCGNLEFSCCSISLSWERRYVVAS